MDEVNNIKIEAEKILGRELTYADTIVFESLMSNSSMDKQRLLEILKFAKEKCKEKSLSYIYCTGVEWMTANIYTADEAIKKENANRYGNDDMTEGRFSAPAKAAKKRIDTASAPSYDMDMAIKQANTTVPELKKNELKKCCFAKQKK